MADENVMRSFMMKLGFKVDKHQERRFDQSVTGATQNILSLKTGVVALVAAAATGFYKITNDMSGLYYESKRLGAGAKNLRAFGFAASQTGSSAEGAVSSVEKLATAMRESPGVESLVGSLGVQTRDANGELRSRVKIMQDLLGKLDKMPMYMAEAYSKSLGINEKLMLAHRQNPERFKKTQQQFMDSMKGVDYGKLTKQSRALTKQFALLKSSFENAALAASQAIGKGGLVADLKDLNKWFSTHGAEIGQDIGTWVSAFDKLGNAINTANDAMSGWGKAVHDKVVSPVANYFGFDSTAYSDGGHKQKANAPSSAKQRREKLRAGLSKAGLSHKEVVAYLANARAESNYRIDKTGDHGKAFGPWQYHANRLRDFTKIIGKKYRDKSVTAGDWAKYTAWEVRNKNPNASAAIKNAANVSDATKLFMRRIENPANQSPGAIAKRQGYADQINVQVHMTGGDSNAEEQARRGAQRGTQEALNRQTMLATRNGRSKTQ
jgi:hypothetical protein